jgi:uroporphyrinogen decarboxylase
LIDRVERLPLPDPDVGRLLAVLRRQRPDRVPLLELKLDEEVRSSLAGEPLVSWWTGAPSDQRMHAVRQFVRLMYRLGYDAFWIPTNVPFSFRTDSTSDTAIMNRGERTWQSEHAGPIQSIRDFEEYRWPKLSDIDFGPAEEIARILPEGMGCIGFCNGVFEWSSWLMGLESFALGLHDQPQLIRELVDRVGRLILQIYEVWVQREEIVALWSGDDMGFKTGTLVSPAHLREYILPWHRRYAELAHDRGKAYILHSCGNLAAIMPDLADEVRIDAKHSFEDVIEPVEEFQRKWGGRVAAIGGVDVDLLARGSEDTVARRTRQILEACAASGGYAAGSGNTVTNYVPVDNYLAMVETVHRFNGRL